MMQQPPSMLRVPTMTAEEKALYAKRKKMALHLTRRSPNQTNGRTSRDIELDLFARSANNTMLYVEACTKYLYSMEGNDTVEPLKAYYEEEKNVSNMFEAEVSIVTDSRNALSRCGKCKSTNVRNTARQVRSAGKFFFSFLCPLTFFYIYSRPFVLTSFLPKKQTRGCPSSQHVLSAGRVGCSASIFCTARILLWTGANTTYRKNNPCKN